MKKYANKLGIKWYGNRFKIAIAQGLLWNEINSKAFAYPYSDCYIVNYKLDAVRIGIANALEFISVL